MLLENRKWDLIIFDEAHRLSAKEYGRKTNKTQNYQLAEVLRDYTDALLLLTATPHAGDPNHSRFVNLVRLLEPKVDFSPLIDQPLFRERDAVPYSKLILRTPKLKVTDAEGKVVFKGRLTHPLPFSMHPDEREFYGAVEDYIRTGYNSLFPGSAALAEDKLWVVPNEVEKLKTWRLTLTFPVINSAREVIFLVAGADKAETLRRVLRPASAADSFPAQRIQPINGQLRWYLDQAAARLL